MANSIEDSKMKTSRFVSFTSRYNDSRVVYYNINGTKKIAFETYKKNLYPASSNDRFMFLKPQHEYRPDLVSLKVYGSEDFWWRIMEANNIKDVFEFKAGITIRIPAQPF